MSPKNLIKILESKGFVVPLHKGGPSEMEIKPLDKIKPIAILLIVGAIIFSCKPDKEESLKNTIFKLGYKTDTFSTGPLSNSGFILKLHDTIPILFLTAHHVVAGNGNGNQYYKWDQLKEKVKNAWIWSMHDSTYQTNLEENLPISNAATLRLDLAAFYLPADKIQYLIPSLGPAQAGDTVQLFSKISYSDSTTFLNPAIVLYATDSVLVYELMKFNMAQIMNGTSGSAVINSRGEVIANSYAGFTIPNQEIKEEMTKEFPLLSKIKIKEGKSYGVGVPINLIQKRLIQAIQFEKQNNKAK